MGHLKMAYYVLSHSTTDREGACLCIDYPGLIPRLTIIHYIIHYIPEHRHKYLWVSQSDPK